MTIRKPAELLDGLAAGTRLLGLDVGTRTVGLALSDVERRIATPYATVKRTRLAADLARIAETIAGEGVGALVVGLPINMDGSEGPRCQATRQFAKDLLARHDLPLAFWDERLSTRAAESTLLAADLSRKRRKEVIDKVAAAIVLQSLIDFLRTRMGGTAGL
ncbi:MAG TPA: Holliday junction resolvase RuvX [Alphaproteobacteria bacterium]|jgi:putative Holliday junction resolvase